VVAFNIIETLFDLGVLGATFKELGLQESDAKLFRAQLLRDALALDATRKFRTFEEVAIGTFAVLLASRGLEPKHETIETIVTQFSNLPPFPDVRDGLARFQAAGIRMVALTNAAMLGTHHMLEHAGLESFFERIFSIDEVRRWKPAQTVYRHATGLLGIEPEHMALVAAHAWDVHGAKEAGLSAAWLKRNEKLFHPAMHRPDVTGESLPELAETLLNLPA
jgi:2-haloacid dehalogenase